MLMVVSPDTALNRNRLGTQFLAAVTFQSAVEVLWYATCRYGQPAARDRLLFCNDRIYGPSLEGVVGREGQQEQPLEAENPVVFARPNIIWLR